MVNRFSLRRLGGGLPAASTLALAGLLCGAASARPVAPQGTTGPQPYAIENVQIGTAEGASTQTLILRDGRISGILSEGEELPPGLRRLDGEGLICLPGFLDAYSRTACETPEPRVDRDRPVLTVSDVRVEMRQANRKGIQPSFGAVDALNWEDDVAERYRSSGFGILHSCPGGQLLAGNSSLLTTRSGAVRDLVVRSEVWAHGTFGATGSGYPSTLMGYHAQLRQFFYDARRHEELQRRYSDGRPGERPPWDEDLEAGAPILNGERSLACFANSSRDIERWLRLSGEFGFQPIVTGGLEAWRVADRLAGSSVPVLLTLDWGDEVDDPEEEDDSGEEGDSSEDEGGAEESEDEGEAEASDESEIDWDYEEPLGVRIERRRQWVEDRDGAMVLAEKGVAFAFGTGSDKPKDLLGNVRTLVENGLDENEALAALTTRSAELLGVDSHLGKVEPGFDATLALWTANPLTDEDAKVAWMFVDGFEFEFDVEDSGGAGEGPSEGVDATGTWMIETDDEDSDGGEAVLVMEEDGTVTGSYTVEGPDGDDVTFDVNGHVNGSQLAMSGTFAVDGMKIEVSFDGELDGDSCSGDLEVNAEGFEMSMKFEGTREPGMVEVVR